MRVGVVFIALFQCQVGEMPPEKPIFKENTEVARTLAPPLRSTKGDRNPILNTPWSMLQADGPDQHLSLLTGWASKLSNGIWLMLQHPQPP